MLIIPLIKEKETYLTYKLMQAFQHPDKPSSRPKSSKLGLKTNKTLKRNNKTMAAGEVYVHSKEGDIIS